MKQPSQDFRLAVIQLWALAAFTLVWGGIFQNDHTMWGAFFIAVSAITVWSSRKFAARLDEDEFEDFDMHDQR